LRKKLRARLRLERAGLVHSRENDPQVVAVGEGNLNQVLQHGILKNAPPRQVGEGVGGKVVCRTAENRRRVDCGAFVVRANGASGQQQRRDAEMNREE
jgi:hypothetical protein